MPAHRGQACPHSVWLCRKPDWLADLKADLRLVKAAEQALVLEQSV